MRLVNEEAVAYGDQPAAYTNILAELVLRIFQEKSKTDPQAKMSIGLICTRFMMNEGRTPLKDEEYKKRLNEYLKFVAVRRGLAADSSNWMVDGMILNAGRNRPELQICDLLSNASHNDYEKLDYKNPRRRSPISRKLDEAFKSYNWTMIVRELIERVDHLVEEYSYGMALLALAERLSQQGDGSKADIDFRDKANQRLESILERMVRIGARGRDPQLAVLVNWLDQIIGQQRLPEKGYQLAQWLLKHVATPLRQRLLALKEGNTIDWFAYSLHRWALTAANHRGALIDAEGEINAMRILQPSLASQWERAALLMDGFIVQAVHQTDCFDYDQASARMKLISKSLETQSNLFHQYMPAEFPTLLHFDLRAKALGTLVQSETLAGLGNPIEARKASDEAINEFSSVDDKARQYQYRCHLEMVAGEFENARFYLVKSLNPTEAMSSDTSHFRIKDLITKLGEGTAWKQGFALLHWLRLGAMICLHGSNRTEQDEFLNALDASPLLETELCKGETSAYPVHSILRWLAVIQSSRGNWEAALTALYRLHDIDPISEEHLVLGTILLAAQAEVAALLWELDETRARSLLINDQSKPLGLLQSIQLMQEKGAQQLPAMWALLNPWSGRIKKLLEATPSQVTGSEVKKELLDMASAIRF